MVQLAIQADRRVFRNAVAARATYDHETTDDDRETLKTSRLRRQLSPAARQTQSDRTDSCRQPSVNFSFLRNASHRLHRFVAGFLLNSPRLKLRQNRV